MDKIELIQELDGRLISLAERISKDSSWKNVYSWSTEFDSIKNDTLVVIRRSFRGDVVLMQKVNNILMPSNGTGVLMGHDPAFSYYQGMNQLRSLLNSMKRELEIYGKQSESQSSAPSLIVMNLGSKLALRDFIDHPVTVNAFLTALIKAVEESSDIPEPDKITLKQQLTLLIANPYISGTVTGLGSSVIASYIMKTLGLG